MGWALIQYDWRPSKKRLGHKHMCREAHMETQGEDGHLQAKERGLRRSQPCRHLDRSETSSFQNGEKINFSVKYPICGSLLCISKIIQ